MSASPRGFAPSDADDARHMPQNRWGSVSIRIEIVPVLMRLPHVLALRRCGTSRGSVLVHAYKFFRFFPSI